ncbi:MAG: hypothetical protein E7553_07110 [Ruminococcaceae bacterium]|nr:hypothetical protein [Oscillospiraceae bacterium]
MKRYLSMLLTVAILLAVVPMAGCSSAPVAVNSEAFRLSGITDVTDDDAVSAYLVTAPYTDTYTVTSQDTEAIRLYDGGKCLASGEGELSVELTEGASYTLEVKTAQSNAMFTVNVQADNHLITLPYDVNTPADVTNVSLESNGSDPLTPAQVNYVPREGGTYVYSNNPEQFRPNHVNQAFMRNEGLTGEVYVTFEHANYSGASVYLGYQLKNDTDHDVYVTITNVGYQSTGTWFGQLAWYDFYNTKFELPAGYYNQNGTVSAKYQSFPDYAYQDYEPRVFQPMTYRLPAGEYFWAIGGTSEDAYLKLNIDESANELVNNVRCANGNVKFTVTGGEVTGTMYAYNDAAEIADHPKALGYVAGGYAQQYSGIAHHHGVIDNYMTWTFSDETKDGSLPVTFTNYYDDNLPRQTAPYAAYNSTPHTVERGTSWMTHLNPQNDHQAVGMDMVEFIWHDENGDEVIIDNDHADGAGLPANTANWMIEYQDHFTLVNQGDTARKVKLSFRDHGTLAMLVRDSQTGEVLKARYTMGLCEENTSYAYVVTVPAHSVKQITMDYLLVACSYGSVKHFATLSTPEGE